MFRKLSAAFLIVAMLCVIGCTTHIHTVGKGPQGYEVEQERQWYVLWGLVPMNKIDTREMAGDATDYEIVTSETPLDVIINLVTGLVTISTRSVTVRK